MINVMEQTTMTSALDDFLRHCRFERKLDEKTISAYRCDIIQFAGTLANGSETLVVNIKRDDIQCWLETISAFKFRTMKRKIASVNAFMRYMEWLFEDFNNPLRQVRIKLKEPQRLPVVMTKAETGRILARLDENVRSGKGFSQSHKLAVRNKAVIELLFGTGMRIGELCGLRNCDVDLERGLVRIIGKGNKERVVDVCMPVTLAALREWVQVRETPTDTNAFFFTNRLGHGLAPQIVRLLVHQIAKECNIDKNVTPHTFRHTFATLLLEENVDVFTIQHILGHSSISTTQIYLHVNPVRQRDILTNHHARSRM